MSSLSRLSAAPENMVPGHFNAHSTPSPQHGANFILDTGCGGSTYAQSFSMIHGCWLDILAEPARGGFRRFLGWTVAALPVPHDWLRARTLLAPIGQRLARHEIVATMELDQAVADAYDVPLRHLTPLLAWYTP